MSVKNLETPYVIILVTTSSKMEAENIAQGLLEKRLIACANIIGPVSSHFHWHGNVEHAEEYLVLMKSRLNLFKDVSEHVKIVHSYEIPEILALPVIAGDQQYLGWLSVSLK